MQLINNLVPRKKKASLTRVIAIVAILISGYQIWIKLFGEDELLAAANFIGTWILTPICALMSIILFGYMVHYFFWHVPKKIISMHKN